MKTRDRAPGANGRSRHAVWVIRALQLSPVLAGLLLAIAWFGVPGMLRGQMIAIASYEPPPGIEIGSPEFPRFDRREMVAQYYSEADMRKAGGGTTVVERLNTAASESWKAGTDRHDSLFSSEMSVAPIAWPPDDPSFAPLEEFERREGARVFAWVLPPQTMPPVYASATPAPHLLYTATELDSYWDATSTPEADFLSSTTYYGKRPPVNETAVNSGGGSGDAKRQIMHSEIPLNGERWRFVVVSEADLAGGTGGTSYDQFPQELVTMSPRAAAYQSLLEDAARAEGVNVFVLGPIDYPSVPLRLPAGATLEDAQDLGESLWPGDVSGSSMHSAVAREIPRAVARAAGGRYFALSFGSLFGGAPSYDEGPYDGPDDTAPQTIMYAAVWDRDPALPTDAGTLLQAWRSARVWHASNLPLILGVCSLLLAMSLVASPAAFVYERRRAESARVLQEMTRVQQDAHDKVYNRLSALSKRVEIESRSLQSDVADSFDSIAEDIRTTVGDLQQILGDERRHVNGRSLARLDVASSLQRVCASQASRLGVEVNCEVTEDLPALPTEMGWDLQCMAEEAITNAARHGAATRVDVTLGWSPCEVELVVRDDGVGTQITAASDTAPDSTGLRGMEQRAMQWAGSVNLSATERGTVLAVRLALPAESDEDVERPES